MKILDSTSFKQKAETSHIPSDLESWFNNTNDCRSLFSDLGFTLLTEEEIHEIQHPYPMDFKDDLSYSATKEVLSKLLLVAQNSNKVYFGYSLLDDSSIMKAPVISYKNGYFYLSPGTLTETLLVEFVKENEEQYKKHQQAFKNYGFQISDFQKLAEEEDKTYEHYIDPDDQIESLKKGRNLSHLAFETSDKTFLEWQSPRFGTTNPTVVHSALWTSSIYSKQGAYAIRNHYKGALSQVTWCFDRFGQSITRVNNKEIFIAGEHEDSYDPDFYIYNDVVVVNSDNSVEIYNYPKEIFPPTDFHTATLINKKTILIIGSLGYMNERAENFTPVYALNIDNFEIEKIVTKGENPGWIYRHRALLSTDNKSIKILGGEIQSKTNLENIDEWQLDLQTFEWKRLTHKKWKRWRIQRKDGQRNHFWDIRQALFSINAAWKSGEQEVNDLKKELGYAIDVTKIEELYEFNGIPTYKKVPEDADEYNIYRIKIHNVCIKFQESHYYIQATVEGYLDDQIITQIQEQQLQKIAALENCMHIIERY